ncbi:MAG: hypothetical protein A3H97_00960 [Acidobacteria bacterium RIFCSPLOWO2_02_FULL_65_29]|nr:MAG: hypothetical protein A3H97_00960 [Acidobacteria bacterium RIFCSPLOWO2_02_FULL_65_29]
MTGAGQVLLQFRQPWRDGTTHLVFDPVEFLGRLAVLVPRPRINLILYHGVLGACPSNRFSRNAVSKTLEKSRCAIAKTADFGITRTRS